MENKELLLKTAFCCMACDGNIAQEEVSLIKDIADNSNLFEGIDIEENLNEYVEEINQKGKDFLTHFLSEIKDASLNEADELEIIKIAIRTIEADNNIEYSEIKFFKKIREQLRISDGKIERAFPENENLEMYLLPDIKESGDIEWNANFSTITL